MKRIPHHQLPEEEDLDWEEQLIETYQTPKNRKKSAPRRAKPQDYDDWDAPKPGSRSRVND